MIDLLKKFLYTGIGMVSTTAEKLQEYLDELAGEGKAYKEEGKKVIDELMKKSQDSVDDVEGMVKDTTEKIAKTLRFPTSKELEAIKKRLDRLEAKLPAPHSAAIVKRTAPKAGVEAVKTGKK